jgi:hypothetical protein
VVVGRLENQAEKCSDWKNYKSAESNAAWFISHRGVVLIADACFSITFFSFHVVEVNSSFWIQIHVWPRQ